MTERRSLGRFREFLSVLLVCIAGLGGFYVLLDPDIYFGTDKWFLRLGSGKFSQELKAAVVTLMIIGGWTKVNEYWLGASAAGQKQSESMSRIAEASAPAAAAAVAAASEKAATPAPAQ